MKLLAYLFMLVITGCATTYQVDTVNKKLAVFEIGYQEAISLAIRLRDQGLLEAGQIDEITRYFDRIDIARNAAYAALEAHKNAVADEYLAVAESALAAANAILEGIENAKRNIRYRTAYVLN